MRIVVAGLIALCLMATACSNTQNSVSQVEINDQKISVEVVKDLESQVKGLSGRKSLPQNAGMLFVYNEKDFRTFWMRDMEFAIDIIWIDGEKIVEITENLPVPTDENIPSYTSKAKVDKALEVNAGFVKGNSIEVGNDVMTYNRYNNHVND